MINVNIILNVPPLCFDNGKCKLGEIVHLFEDENKSLSKGVNALQTDHAISVMQTSNNNIV